MIVAKWFKLSVPKFFVGFGPTLWSKKSSKTEYGVKAIPLGGFVLIEDDKQEEGKPERNLLSHVSPLKRIPIFLAGPAVNIILGTAILVIMMVTVPFQYVSTTIKSVDSCSSEVSSCGAEKAGVQKGDKILAVDGAEVELSDELVGALQDKKSAVVTILRDGKEINQSVPLTSSKMGVNLSIDERVRTVPEAFEQMGTVIALNIDSIKEIPSKMPGVVKSIFGADREPDAPSSIISVGKTYGDVSADAQIPAPDKLQMLIMYSGLLNIGLGLINLLPLMPLDGGRIVIALFDWVKMGYSKFARRQYSPAGIKMVGVMTAVTGSVVLAFMATLMLSDVSLWTRGGL